MGFLWGAAFSKFEGALKYNSGFYPALSPLGQWLLGSLMDATHHCQYGLAVVLLVMKIPWFPSHPTISLVLTWMGWGLIASNWKDCKNILKRLNKAQTQVSSVAVQGRLLGRN